MKQLSIVLIALFLFSCASEKRKIEKAVEVAYKHPNEFAGFCGALFPVKDSLGKIVIKYLPADNSAYKNTTDSLNQEIEVLKKEVSKDKDCDKYLNQIKSLQAKVNSLQNKRVKPDTVYIEKPIFRENVAKVNDLTAKLNTKTNELSQSNTDRDKYKKSSDTRLFYIISLLILFLGSVFLLFKKW